jgi:putative DNA primase/helicase
MENRMKYIEDKFHQALRDSGLNTSSPIIFDGKIHRFYVGGDKKGSRNGWYVLFDGNIPAGKFGSWKTGLSKTWSSKSCKEMTSYEQSIYKNQIEEAKQLRKKELAREQLNASKAADKTWKKSKPVSISNKYLKRKKILPYGLREDENRNLVVPIYDQDGCIKSLQFIKENGEKRFLSGGAIKGNYYTLGSLQSEHIFICEGYATGATIFQAYEGLIIIAFNSGNLLSVAKNIKKNSQKKELPYVVIMTNGQMETQEKPKP